MKKLISIIFIVFVAGIIVMVSAKNCKQITVLKHHEIGDVLDSFNGVYVYYNGNISNTNGRNLTKDGYNLGIKYQCVEFVKRYYYEHYHHKMTNPAGNAVDFFNKRIRDGKLNPDKGLTQFTNPSKSKPRVGDLLIYSGTTFNKYGHVCIVSKVSEDEIEIIQQNPGPGAPSRVNFNLIHQSGKWKIDNSRILGWLRK